jgi:hypothetical protein
MWSYDHGVRLDFSSPGKPTDNSYFETFTDRYAKNAERALFARWPKQRVLEACAGLQTRAVLTVLSMSCPAEYARKIKEMEPA